MIRVGDIVQPNLLGRLAGFDRRDGGEVAELRLDECDGWPLEARIGARWIDAGWLEPAEGEVSQ